MKKIFFFFLAICINLEAQQFSLPEEFSWDDRSGKNYISPANDQMVQGPCHAFAAIALLEAAFQIYFNKCISEHPIKLSEQHVFSSCNPYLSGGPIIYANNALDFIVSEGVVAEDCLPYTCDPSPPDEPVDCFDFIDNSECIGLKESCSELASIPGYNTYEDSEILDNNDLKQLIFKEGPVMAFLPKYIINEIHGEDYNHSFLVIGWTIENNIHKWRIKDSWPGLSVHERIYNTPVDIVNNDYSDRYYYTTKFIDGDDRISSKVFDEGDRSCEDKDDDGFYYWGIGPKPNNCPGPCLMDHDDTDPNVIFYDEVYGLQNTPTVTGDDFVCESGATFYFHDLPTGFNSPDWMVAPSSEFYGNTNGTADQATVTPKPQYIGNEAVMMFTISDECGSASYTKEFFINGPNPHYHLWIDVIPSAWDSPQPIYYNGIWLVCPHTTYHLHINNSSDCEVYDFDWIIPPAWTKYYQYGNMVSINTNNDPSQIVELLAKTCCYADQQSRVNIKTQHFGHSYNCGNPYYSVYPNPSIEHFTISFTEKFNPDTKDKSLEIFNQNMVIKQQLGSFESNEITINTSGWRGGIYYIRLRYNGQYYYYQVKVGRQ